MATTSLPWTGDADADRLLADNPLALMLGMLLDQQVKMEWAFKAPFLLQERLGASLDATSSAFTAAPSASCLDCTSALAVSNRLKAPSRSVFVETASP